jgi:hypothetical protein
VGCARQRQERHRVRVCVCVGKDAGEKCRNKRESERDQEATTTPLPPSYGGTCIAQTHGGGGV